MEFGGRHGAGSHRQPLQWVLRLGNAEVLLGRNRQVSQEGFFFTHLCPLWKFDFALLWLAFSLRPKHPRNEHREKLQGGDLERKIYQRVHHDSSQRKNAGR